MNSTTVPKRLGFDTNILIYSVDLRDRSKYEVDRRVVRRCGELDGVIALQCLSEFYQATTRKALVTSDFAAKVVQETKDALTVEPMNESDLLAAIKACEDGMVQFYDALMRCTAERAGVTIFFSEDFNSGEKFGKLQVLNPFKLPTAELDLLLT